MPTSWEAEELRRKELNRRIVRWVASSLLVVLAVSLLAMWGCPQYRVYSRRLTGESELAQATYNRRIKVQEAQAALDSASKLAEAEVARARGVAKANQIIGQSLKGNEAYLHYLWVQALADKQAAEVIYVPTEANLPITEAGRLGQSFTETHKPETP